MISICRILRSALRCRTVVSSLGVIAMVACLVFGAVGCSGGSEEIVAEVGGKVITKASFEHWMSVAAARNYESVPRKPVPKWVLPQPPRYASCISHLALTARAANGVGPPSMGQLKEECAKSYQALRIQVMQSLLTGVWLIAEGEAHGLHATDKEVGARVQRVEKEEIGGPDAVKRYLVNTGEMVADRWFRSRIKVFSKKLEQQIKASVKGDSQQAVLKFVLAFPRKWAAKTKCQPGYVVPDCSEYKGDVAPEARLL